MTAGPLQGAPLHPEPAAPLRAPAACTVSAYHLIYKLRHPTCFLLCVCACLQLKGGAEADGVQREADIIMANVYR